VILLLQEHFGFVLRGELSDSDWKEMDERRNREGLRIYRELTGRDPIVIEATEESERMIQEEIERRRLAQQKSIPWWAFWRK
jgi:hypothetical protein